MRHNSTILLCILLFLTYAMVGYLRFIDGEYVRKIVIWNKTQEYNHCITHFTEKKEYKRGEMVEAVARVEQFREIEAVEQWSLMDARFYPYTPKRICLPKGRHAINVQIERIPDHIPPGEYFFIGTVKYEANFLRDIYVPIRTNKFAVK